ncbi:MAG TPA: sigma-54 dependent transcriptional regulator, partial [bacterium]|nr:sigma-54 dependent transcriptional regulator [bacterium]
VARAVHYNSPRSKKRFVPVDCNALADNLFESEMFGHERGAFTGAVRDKKGLIEEADGGTLFLDEISNISLDAQAKLLRALESREVKHVGGAELKRVDFRLICATNKDLMKMVQEGTFREDLYYRINVFPINLPPLRKRPEDIPMLAAHFLKNFASETAKNITGIDRDAMDLLSGHDWPGNVRELKNVIERIVIMTFSDTVSRRTVAEILGKAAGADENEAAPENNEELKEARRVAKKQAVEEIEKKFVINALKKSGWNITKAARETGMQRQNFQALVSKFKIEAEDDEE